MEQQPGTEITDLAALKVLAQPRRQQILEQLALHGPSTSAILARTLGLNSGATSYHLRALARYGFVEEADGAAPRGERWWRVVPGDRRFPPRSRQNPEMRLVMDELNHHAYAADLDLFERLRRASDPLDAWADAFPYSRGSIRLRSHCSDSSSSGQGPVAGWQWPTSARTPFGPLPHSPRSPCSSG